MRSKEIPAEAARIFVDGFGADCRWIKQRRALSLSLIHILLRREHEAWTEDLNGISRQYGKLSAEEFADKLARSLEKRGCMLKLMSMNIYDMEVNSRLENLADFKKSYANALQAVTCCLERFFPSMTADNIQEFLYALFPFLFGVYPYTSHTEKQIQAMKMAHVHFISHSIYELVKPFAVRLLQSFSP